MLRAYLLAVGLASVVFGLWTGLKQAKNRARWVRAIGVVVGSVELQDAEDASKSMHFARIGFSTAEGKRFEFGSRVGETTEPALGRRFGVRYDPDQPSSAVEDSFLAQWGFSTVLCGLGALSLLVAFLSPSI